MEQWLFPALCPMPSAFAGAAADKACSMLLIGTLINADFQARIHADRKKP